MSQAGWTAVEPGATTADPTDVIGRRAAAKIIDTLIASAIGSLGLISIVLSFHSHAVPDAVEYCNRIQSSSHACFPVGTNSVWEFNQPSPLLYLPGFIWWFVIAWLEGHFGWTPGKLALGLRVMRSTTGKVCGFGPSLIRNLLWIVDGFFFGVVALFVALRSPGHRRLGDQAAATLVVDKSALGSIPDLPGLVPVAYSGGAAAPTFPPDTPIWDEARNTYILWDSTRQEWLGWNRHASRWYPLKR